MTNRDNFNRELKIAIEEHEEEFQRVFRPYQNEREAHIVLKIASVFGLAKSLLYLIESDHSPGARALLRIAFLAYVDLINLIDDEQPTYVYQLLHTNLLQEKKFLERAQKMQNFNQYLSDRPDALDPKTLARVKSNLVETKAAGGVRLTDADRFEKAKMRDFFDSWYWDFSLTVHNSTSSLVFGHVKEYESRYEVFTNTGFNDTDLNGIRDNLLKLMRDAVNGYKKYCDENPPDHIELPGSDVHDPDSP